jgi:DNA-binding transcriptional LysR family regulator
MTHSSPLLLSLELRLLRYVIAVAEELHFTRASQRLHLATPSLSKQIRQLEQVLGYSLFERKTREVVLTPAGAAFVAEARLALMHVQRAVEAGAAANAAHAGVVCIGYTPLLDAALLPQIRESFVQAANEATLLFQSTYSTAQIDQILSGHLHAGLVVLPIGTTELRTDSVFRDRLVAAIPERSNMTTRTVLCPEDIAEQPVIWFGKLTNPHLYRYFVDSCRRAGFTPNIVQGVSTIMEMLDLVSAGAGIGFTKDSVRTRLHPEGIAFRELAAPGLSIEIGVAYRDEDCSESLLALLQVLARLSTGV